jgi:hypothetical protein
MIVVDEYLAIRAFVGDLPTDVPDDFLGIPVSAHWRLLQRLHSGGDGQLSRLLAQLPEADREALRTPHPHVVEVLDPRPLLDEAARISARFGGTGWLIAESVTAALHHGRQLWYGSERNIGGRLREIADELGIDVRVAR